MYYSPHILSQEVKNYNSYDYYTKLKKVLEHLDPNNSDSYENWDLIIGYLREYESPYKCSCSHMINYELRIKHKTTGDIISIGSKCIEKFFPNYVYYKATLIINKYKNPNKKFCEHCEKRVNDSIVHEFKFQSEFYHKKCLKIKFDKCPICKKFEKYDCRCNRIKCISNGCKFMLFNPPPWKVRCIPCYIDMKNNLKK